MRKCNLLNFEMVFDVLEEGIVQLYTEPPLSSEIWLLVLRFMISWIVLSNSFLHSSENYQAF